eukprot:Hpha_TRINITY_DN34556_c0_g1::TRINITY_DN34556_c0_g1_i1::g.96374::m.96374
MQDDITEGSGDEAAAISQVPVKSVLSRSPTNLSRSTRGPPRSEPAGSRAAGDTPMTPTDEGVNPMKRTESRLSDRQEALARISRKLSKSNLGSSSLSEVRAEPPAESVGEDVRSQRSQRALSLSRRRTAERGELSNLTRQVSDAKSQLEQLQKEKGDVEREVSMRRKEKDEVEKEVSLRQKEKGEVEMEVSMRRKEMEEVEKEVSVRQKERDEIEKEVSQRREESSELAKSVNLARAESKRSLDVAQGQSQREAEEVGALRARAAEAEAGLQAAKSEIEALQRRCEAAEVEACRFRDTQPELEALQRRLETAQREAASAPSLSSFIAVQTQSNILALSGVGWREAARRKEVELEALDELMASLVPSLGPRPPNGNESGLRAKLAEVEKDRDAALVSSRLAETEADALRARLYDSVRMAPPTPSPALIAAATPAILTDPEEVVELRRGLEAARDDALSLRNQVHSLRLDRNETLGELKAERALRTELLRRFADDSAPPSNGDPPTAPTVTPAPAVTPVRHQPTGSLEVQVETLQRKHQRSKRREAEAKEEVLRLREELRTVTAAHALVHSSVTMPQTSVVSHSSGWSGGQPCEPTGGSVPPPVPWETPRGHEGVGQVLLGLQQDALRKDSENILRGPTARSAPHTQDTTPTPTPGRYSA